MQRSSSSPWPTTNRAFFGTPLTDTRLPSVAHAHVRIFAASDRPPHAHESSDSLTSQSARAVEDMAGATEDLRRRRRIGHPTGAWRPSADIHGRPTTAVLRAIDAAVRCEAARVASMMVMRLEHWERAADRGGIGALSGLLRADATALLVQEWDREIATSSAAQQAGVAVVARLLLSRLQKSHSGAGTLETARSHCLDTASTESELLAQLACVAVARSAAQRWAAAVKATSSAPPRSRHAHDGQLGSRRPLVEPHPSRLEGAADRFLQTLSKGVGGLPVKGERDTAHKGPDATLWTGVRSMR